MQLLRQRAIAVPYLTTKQLKEPTLEARLGRVSPPDSVVAEVAAMSALLASVDITGSAAAGTNEAAALDLARLPSKDLQNVVREWILLEDTDRISIDEAELAMMDMGAPQPSEVDDLPPNSDTPAPTTPAARSSSSRLRELNLELKPLLLEM
jgi:hypothetical protein